jgi:hypothetical protein
LIAIAVSNVLGSDASVGSVGMADSDFVFVAIRSLVYQGNEHVGSFGREGLGSSVETMTRSLVVPVVVVSA